ncbi:MAG: O-antigen ligase family protein [Bacteroidales bacterium]|nr:O-antigen ligase family protein [Bacteroidales bacterium]MCF8405298.1 O-antigen ligase family protein [Bacteroidales bacterium]
MYYFLKKNSNEVFLGFLGLMFISLPVSRFGLSVAQFGLLGIWLIDGKYVEKFKTLQKNKAALILVSFYVLHVIGLLYTSDFNYAFKDLRIKLPLLFLPIVFATSPPVNLKILNRLMQIYVATVVVASFISLIILLTRDVSNFRDLSPFISHIRFSLNVCFAIFILGYSFFESPELNRNYKIVSGVMAFWLVIFLVLIQSVTGLVILFITSLTLAIIGMLKMKRDSHVKYLLLTGIVGFPIILGILFRFVAGEYFTPHKESVREEYTIKGNAYVHDTINQPVENGNYIWTYVCEKELKESWNKVSGLPYDGKDEKNQILKHTLIRYLNSKNLKKDAEGIAQLSPKDIRNIEMGTANFYYTKKLSFKSRLYKLFWEYQLSQRANNPEGHSVLQRVEYWKAAAHIIQENFIIGVGTGDINQEFMTYYEKTDSQLSQDNRRRAHNQYLAIFVSFGIIGLAWFIVSLIFPAILIQQFSNYYYLVFWIIIVLSMFMEDTLETQMGVTLYAFLNAFFLFGVNYNSKTSDIEGIL